jgi:hypothetical protein
VGLGAVGVPGGGGQDDGAVGQVLIGPAARAAVERFDRDGTELSKNTSAGTSLSPCDALCFVRQRRR